MAENNKYIAWSKEVKSVEWKDRYEVMLDYPYIKEDKEKEELYIELDELDEDGNKKRQYITLPYVPDPISPYTTRILFQKRLGAENLPLEYSKIDNDNEIMELLVDSDNGVVAWRKEPQNRDVNKRKELGLIDKDTADTYRYEVRAIRVSDFINYLKENWSKWNKVHSTANLPLHKLVETKNNKNEMVEYSKQNKTASKNNYGKVQTDHFNNDTMDNRFFNLRLCYGGENYKPEIDQTIGLNNYVLFYDRDKKGNVIEREFVTDKDGKKIVGKDNKKYCIISRCNSYELSNGKKTTNLIEIRDGKNIVARAEIVMFVFDSYEELKEIVDKVTLSKDETAQTKGDRELINKLKSSRNNGIAEVLQNMLTLENIKNKKVFALAEDSRYALDKEKIGIVDVSRTDENGQPLCIGVAKRKQFEEAKGVESLDHKNIIDLFYYDIENYIKK